MSGQSTGRIAFGIVGAVVGSYFGQPALGYAVGAGLGALAFPDKYDDQQRQGPQLGDLRVTSSSYGRPLPIAFGVVRVAGTLIWSAGIVQHTQTQTEDAPGAPSGKGGGSAQQVTTTTYTYTASLAYSLCEGEILGVRRIWANGDLIFNVGPNANYATYIQSQTIAASIRVYGGSETQEVDPLIAATNPDTPAYRGVAVIVLESLVLASFGNSIPNLEFEVVTQGSVATALSQLDAALQFGIAANGTITPDGLLLLAYEQTASPFTSRLVLVNPFDLSPIRDYDVNALLSGTHVAPSVAPRLNGAGDILFVDENSAFVFWAVGSTPATISIDAPTRSWIDQDGFFYFAARMLDLHYRLVRVYPTQRDPVTGEVSFGGFQTTIRDYGTTTAGKVLDVFKIPGSWIYLAYTASTGIVEKIDPNAGGAVAASFVTAATPYSLCVAGDDSVWYLRGGNDQIWRIAPDFSSEALIHNSGASAAGSGTARLNRDWATGDILWAGSDSSLARYSESGTLLSTHTVSNTTFVVETNASFPERVYVFGNQPLGIGNQFVHVYRRISLTESTVSVADAISAICARVGLTGADIDVTALSAQLRGYVFAQRGPARGVITQLLTAFGCDAVESAGKLKFVLRGAMSATTITEGDLGAKLGDMREDSEAYSITRVQEPELPHEVALNYLDVNANYQVGTQYGRRLIGHSDNDQSLNLAVALTATEAVHIAQTLLYEAWAARQQYKVSVSTKWARLEPTDPVTLAFDDGQTVEARVQQVVEGQGVRELSLVGYEPSIYTQSGAGAALPEAISAINGLSPTALELLDTALLRDGDDNYGVYVAACGYTDNWPGCEVFKSSDLINYADTGLSFPAPCVMGYAITVLLDFAGGNFFDELSTVEVSVLAGTLSSTTAAAVLNGANAFFLGGEIIQAKNAVLIATGRYRLSGLLRGRIGTEWAMPRHVIGQPFVKLDALLMRRMLTPVSDQGVTRFYKGVTFGTAVSQASAKPIAVAGNSLKPLSPTHVGGGRDASANITIKWIRRARRGAAWVNSVDVAIDEPSENYEVDLFAGTGTTITGITNSVNGVFTATAHGLIVGDAVHITGVLGMTQVNSRVYSVATVADADHFTVGEQTAGYPAYTSGGKVRKKARTLTPITTTTTSYSAANQTTDYGSTQATVYVAVYQLSARVGRGYPGIGVI